MRERQNNLDLVLHEYVWIYLNTCYLATILNSIKELAYKPVDFIYYPQLILLEVDLLRFHSCDASAATIKLLRTRNTQHNYFRRLKSDAVRDIVRDRRLTRTYYESTSRFIRIIYLIANDVSRSYHHVFMYVHYTMLDLFVIENHDIKH